MSVFHLHISLYPSLLRQQHVVLSTTFTCAVMLSVGLEESSQQHIILPWSPCMMKLLTTLPSLGCIRGPNVLKIRATRMSTLSCIELNDLLELECCFRVKRQRRAPCFGSYMHTSLFPPHVSPWVFILSDVKHKKNLRIYFESNNILQSETQHFYIPHHSMPLGQWG